MKFLKLNERLRWITMRNPERGSEHNDGSIEMVYQFVTYRHLGKHVLIKFKQYM